MAIKLREAVRNRLEGKQIFKTFSISEVKQHNKTTDAYIIVDQYVYDITNHVLNHPGWTCGCSVSELLAILRNLGMKILKTEKMTLLPSHRYLGMQETIALKSSWKCIVIGQKKCCNHTW